MGASYCGQAVHTLLHPGHRPAPAGGLADGEDAGEQLYGVVHARCALRMLLRMLCALCIPAPAAAAATVQPGGPPSPGPGVHYSRCGYRLLVRATHLYSMPC